MRAVIILFSIIVLMAGCAFRNPRVDALKDPFNVVLLEYEDIIAAIFAPLYPNLHLLTPLPDTATVVQYFLDNDFTEEIEALRGIYQKAVDADQNNKDQSFSAKNFRASCLRRLEERLSIFEAGLEVIQRYSYKDELVFTQDETRKLTDFAWLRRNHMITTNRDW